MNKTTEALKLALKALEHGECPWNMQYEAITAIREALAEPVKQEPVFWVHPMDFGRECGVTPKQESDELIPLYAAPIQPVKQEPNYWLGYGLQAHIKKPFEGATPLFTQESLREHTDRIKELQAQLDAYVYEPVDMPQAGPTSVKQEPVAWVNNESVQKLRECGWSNEAIATVVPTINLGAPVDAKAIRAEALEEAAKVCEEQSRESGVAKYPFWNDCAAAIKGLK